MKISKVKIIIGIVLVLVSGGIFGYRTITSSPQYSLYQAMQKIKAHDYDGFKQYVDVEQISEDAVNEIVQKVKDQMNKETEDDEWAQWGANFGGMLIDSYTPKIKGQVSEHIRQVVEDSDFNAKNNDFSKIPTIDFWKKTKITRDGKVALVMVSGLEIEEGNPVSLKMRQVKKHWQVFSVDIDFGKLIGSPTTDAQTSSSDESVDPLEKARQKAKDSRIKAGIQQLRVLAESQLNDKSVYSLVTETKITEDITTQGGNLTQSIATNGVSYCASSSLPSGDPENFCLDSTANQTAGICVEGVCQLSNHK